MTAPSPPSTSECTLTILMPVRNEGLNLQIMLRMLRGLLDVQHEVLVVHDTLDDNSISVVEELAETLPVRTVHNTYGRGVVNAIRSGVEAATGQYILVFAADEVGPVLAIEDMLALMDEGCDFVSCTRYAYGGRRLGGSIVGGVLSRTANKLFKWMAGSVFTDCTIGIKMFRRTQFTELAASPSVGWSVAFEMAIKAQLIGLVLGEVPIISIDRLYGGESTFRVAPWTVAYLRWFVWGLLELRMRTGQTSDIIIRIPKSTPTTESIPR